MDMCGLPSREYAGARLKRRSLDEVSSIRDSHAASLRESVTGTLEIQLGGPQNRATSVTGIPAELCHESMAT